MSKCLPLRFAHDQPEFWAMYRILRRLARCTSYSGVSDGSPRGQSKIGLARFCEVHLNDRPDFAPQP